VGGKVIVTGHSETTDAGTAAAGIDMYWAHNSVRNVIEATRGFSSTENSVEITGSSKANHAALLGPTDALTNYLTIRASGEKAGVAISGSTTRASSNGLWLASVTIETKNGPVSINAGDDTLSLGRNSGRIFTYKPISGQTGGDISIQTGSMADSTDMSLTTQGAVTLTPNGASFTGAISFPAASSTVNVGSLVVGSSSNTADLTVGSAVTSASGVTYRGGSNTVSGNVSSTNGSIAV
jgi:hypothetical protein